MSNVPAEKSVLDAVPQKLLIDGQWIDATGSATVAVEDPATGQTLCRVASATPEDGLAALDAAHRAFPAWASTAPRDRAEILRQAFEMIVERADDLALLMTLEMGKPVAESKAEVIYAAEFFRWY